MRKKTSLTIMSLIVIIVAGLTITGVSAYFLSSGLMNNNASVGNNTIGITEEFNNPDIDPEGVTIIKKKVRIVNNGKIEAKVRVSVRFSSSEMLDYTDVDYNTEKWTEEGDGWWSYKENIQPGETTEPLFNKLTITNPGRKTADFDVFVYAECRDK